MSDITVTLTQLNALVKPEFKERLEYIHCDIANRFVLFDKVDNLPVVSVPDPQDFNTAMIQAAIKVHEDTLRSIATGKA